MQFTPLQTTIVDHVVRARPGDKLLLVFAPAVGENRFVARRIGVTTALYEACRFRDDRCTYFFTRHAETSEPYMHFVRDLRDAQLLRRSSASVLEWGDDCFLNHISIRDALDRMGVIQTYQRHYQRPVRAIHGNGRPPSLHLWDSLLVEEAIGLGTVLAARQDSFAATVGILKTTDPLFIGTWHELEAAGWTVIDPRGARPAAPEAP